MQDLYAENCKTLMKNLKKTYTSRNKMFMN